MDFSTFVGAAVHDMKNSVGVITAYLEELLSHLPAGGEDGALMQQTLHEAQRVNGNLVQLMAIYKIERGLYPFNPEETDFAELAAEALARVQPLARIRGMQLETDIPADLPGWYCDRELILSVVTQAIFNALRYTRSRVVVGASVTEEGLAVRVDDDGAGFPAFMLRQDYLLQGIDTQTGSTGLGLYFALQVAQLHRHGAKVGSTRIENLVHRDDIGGGRFILTLP